MIPYSNDLREKIIRFFENHPDYTQQEIADEFEVSRSFLEKLLQRWRTTQSWGRLPPGGGQPRTLQPHEPQIQALIAAQPDATLAELREKIQVSTQLAVSNATMCRALQRLQLPRKKRRINRTSKTDPPSRNKEQNFVHAPPRGWSKS